MYRHANDKQGSKDISYLEPAICLVRLKKPGSSGCENPARNFLAPLHPLTSKITKWRRLRALFQSTKVHKTLDKSAAMLSPFRTSFADKNP